MAVPVLAGVHHLKLPVRDLARSREWYGRVLGYGTDIEFVEDGVLMGVGMTHPAGGPRLAVRLDPERAEASAGFDYFCFAVADEAAIRALAAHLDGLGVAHAGVHWATIGWILPHVTDPDGHELRFYSLSEHGQGPADGVSRDPRESADARERAAAAGPS